MHSDCLQLSKQTKRFARERSRCQTQHCHRYIDTVCFQNLFAMHCTVWVELSTANSRDLGYTEESGAPIGVRLIPDETAMRPEYEFFRSKLDRGSRTNVHSKESFEGVGVGRVKCSPWNAPLHTHRQCAYCLAYHAEYQMLAQPLCRTHTRARPETHIRVRRPVSMSL